MIISISGKIGSGKDTVGKIIQYLSAGADEANIPFDKWDGYSVWGNHDNVFHRRSWQIKKFADKLKDIACILIGCTREQLEDQDFKKTFLPVEWGYWKTPNVHQLMTVREFLQKLGTDAMRNGLHENVWVNSLIGDYKFATYKRGDIIHTASDYPNWIITDTRFPNELEAVKAKGAITIKVTRNWGSTDNLFSQHPSEIALDNAVFDYEIVNDGSIEDLMKKVKMILIEKNFI